MKLIKEYKKYNETVFLKKLGCVRMELYGIHRNQYVAMYKRYVQGKVYFSENENTHFFDKSERGGVITLSTDVNAVFSSSDLIGRITNWFKSGYQSLMNRLSKNKKVFNYLKSLDLMRDKGFTVGNLMKGSYISENGDTYDETSFTVTINGVNSDALNVIASGLAELFNQESVLVHRFTDDETYLLYINKDRNDIRNERINDILDGGIDV